MTRWRTLRKAMVAASAGVAFLAGAAVWWNAWRAWSQSSDDDAQLVAPSVFILCWASLLLAGAILALLRRTTAILIAGWLLCLGQTAYWSMEYVSPSWWASLGIRPPGFERLVANIAAMFALPVLGFLLALPDWLQRRREKAKTDTGVPE